MKETLRRCDIFICIDKKIWNPVGRTIEFIIEKVSGGQGHHVGMMIDETQAIEAHAGKGVDLITMRDYKKDKTVILFARPLFLSSGERMEVAKRALQCRGQKYDNGNILGQAFASGTFNKKNKKICSELVAYAYLPYYQFRGLAPESVTPSDIKVDVCNGWNEYFKLWYYDLESEYSSVP